jgi:Ca2+-binding EF-hand superfamily protein
MNQAIPRIKEALQSRLLFMGRYQLQSGPPLHKSATCVVVNAEDFNASEDYKQAFAKFNKPAISKAEFSTAVASFGINWTRDEFERQFARIDADGTGTVDEAEFIEFCKSVLDNGGNRKVSARPMFKAYPKR